MTQETHERAPTGSRARVAAKVSVWSHDLVIKSATVTGFVAIFIVMQFWLSRGFFVAAPRMLNIHQNVPVLLLATAAVVGLLAGAFDLSISGTATLTAFLAVGLTAQQGLPFPLVLVIVLGVGVAAGLVNGLIVSTLNVNVIIATLGTGSIMVGISAVYSGGAVVTSASGTPLPGWFLDFGRFTTKLPLPLQLVLVAAALCWAFVALGRVRPPAALAPAWPVWRAVLVLVLGAVVYFVFDLQGWIKAISALVGLYLVVVFLIWVLMERTVHGRSMKATGANPLAARLAGVRTGKETYRAFIGTGVLASLAGIALAANQGAASPDVAGGFLLPAFAAAFLSTVIFSRGLFTVTGTAIGGIFIIWVAQGLIEAGLKFTWTGIVNGAVLIVAVSLSTLLQRRNR
ncbi:ABC transporter permease [Saccharomonospora sp. NPDC046836]|uniref:ABC transporter permease n=1 Tax=Saccharomonospora sp. NPDC046836 TaxID=3156921 RepID=UPI0034005B62